MTAEKKLSNFCFVIVIFVTTAVIGRSRQNHRACAVHYQASCAHQLPSDNVRFLPCPGILMDNTLSYLLIHEILIIIILLLTLTTIEINIISS